MTELLMCDPLPTSQTRRVGQAVDAIQSVGGICLISGANGVGKSWSLDLLDREWVRRVDMTASSGQGSGRACYRRICRALDIPVPIQAHADDLLDEIVDTIRGQRQTLVLDRCEHVAARALPFLRDLADALECLVLVGSSAFRARVMQDDALTVRARLPVPVQPLDRQELGELLDSQFSKAWLDECWAATGGVLGHVAQAVRGEMLRSAAAGRPTTDAGGDEAQITCERFVLRRRQAA
jgi:hypothetical protein